jgi:DNA-binding CsgD family transcriptional regulator
MNMSDPAALLERPTLADLTEKEVEVLDRLARHMTSKEIARDLDIAPNTVEKRLLRVREKWGTTDRNSTARLFLELREAGCEKIPPQFSAHDRDAYLLAQPAADLPKSAVFQLSDVLRMEHYAELATPSPKGLQALDERFGKAWRIAAIPLLALLALVVMVFAVNLAELLSELI